MQWTGNNFPEIGFFVGKILTMNEGKIVIETLEGDITASLGDWIIKGVKGEFYPCKPDIFDATYEPAEV